MADLNPLIKSGMAIDELPADQREALNNLDQTEVDALAAIRKKLNTEPEVSGYALSSKADGVIVW
jgi:hypothetical protein